MVPQKHGSSETWFLRPISKLQFFAGATQRLRGCPGQEQVSAIAGASSQVQMTSRPSEGIQDISKIYLYLCVFDIYIGMVILSCICTYTHICTHI